MTNIETIVQVATRLFAEQGFEGTSTKQITLEVGVTEPLIYYHFEGKDDQLSGHDVCIVHILHDEVIVDAAGSGLSSLSMDM